MTGPKTQPRSTGRWPKLVTLVVVTAVVGAGIWYGVTHGMPIFAAGPTLPPGGKPVTAVTAEIVIPRPGGIDRISTQPGTIEPFEAADLYAKASGFLVEQTVDIGSRVAADQVLARLSVPEYDKQVERDKAKLDDAAAKVRQMEAHLEAARAEAKAADAAVTLNEVLVRAKAYYRQYREKQLDRTKDLVKSKALEVRVEEEQEDYYLSAVEAENAAKEAVNAAREKALASRANITRAMADVDEAKAGVGVATADLGRSKVLLGYTAIRAPFSGVVTKRTYHVGDFIKSAEQGGNAPLFAVERTDVMRVVVQVPDRDVPYVSQGDPAVVEIDALPGVVYETHGSERVEVSRWSNTEDPATRSMRTEIDVKNPDGKLRHGMYGRVSILLEPGAPSAVRVPTGSVVGRDVGGKATVRVVRDGHLASIPVILGVDNGLDVEVILGLSVEDRVVVRTSTPVDDGAAVTVASSH